MATFEEVERDAGAYVRTSGIALSYRRMDPYTPAEFDGLSIVVNDAQPAEWRAHYLVHSFGSIVGWCLDLEGVAAMYQELRETKAARHADAERLERAIARFRAFETAASCYGVWLLDSLGHAWAIEAFTSFFRADLEAMTRYHREGRAPDWPEFLRAWREEIAEGRRRADPFEPWPVPSFRPAPFEKQQVKQERGGQ